MQLASLPSLVKRFEWHSMTLSQFSGTSNQCEHLPDMSSSWHVILPFVDNHAIALQQRLGITALKNKILDDLMTSGGFHLVPVEFLSSVVALLPFSSNKQQPNQITSKYLSQNYIFK